MATQAPTLDIQRITAERDLYLRLLNLGRPQAPEPFLKEALGLLVQLSGAHRGYLEIYDDEEKSGVPRWWIADGFTEEEVRNVRATISSGIIAQALATGETIVTDCAWLDPRFSERQSVQSGRIEAVLCAPIGLDPPRGVLYLQGRSSRGLFSEEERHRAEMVGRQLAPIVDHMVTEQRAHAATDPTAPFRERLRLDGVVGRSSALAATLKQVAVVAPFDVPVLLTGDTGTGKTQLARMIHENSPRAGNPFVELNCATFPETLIESELFGAVPGAHSTATKKVVGKVEAAEHGTLFLDEISELSVTAQAKLLQLLESKQYYALGSSQPSCADVRVIAATNIDLQRAVAEKRFRQDLYHRLQGFPIRVPTLAERREDIRELGEYFCTTVCERNRLPRLTLSGSAVRALESAEWPGNVRDLQRVVQNAVIRAVSEGARQLERAHVFPDEEAPVAEAPHQLTFQEATRQFQAQLLLDTLEDSDWNIVETARRLDVARSHVYNLIHAFGIERRER